MTSFVEFMDVNTRVDSVNQPISQQCQLMVWALGVGLASQPFNGGLISFTNLCIKFSVQGVDASVS